MTDAEHKLQSENEAWSLLRRTVDEIALRDVPALRDLILSYPKVDQVVRLRAIRYLFFLNWRQISTTYPNGPSDADAHELARTASTYLSGVVNVHAEEMEKLIMNFFRPDVDGPPSGARFIVIAAGLFVAMSEASVITLERMRVEADDWYARRGFES